MRSRLRYLTWRQAKGLQREFEDGWKRDKEVNDDTQAKHLQRGTHKCLILELCQDRDRAQIVQRCSGR